MGWRHNHHLRACKEYSALDIVKTHNMCIVCCMAANSYARLCPFVRLVRGPCFYAVASLINGFLIKCVVRETALQ